MQNRQTIYFAENDCRVIVGILPTGEYGAYREQDDGRVRGYGATMMEAIADLVASVGDEDDQEDGDSAAFQTDHARDYRKHDHA